MQTNLQQVGKKRRRCTDQTWREDKPAAAYHTSSEEPYIVRWKCCSEPDTSFFFSGSVHNGSQVTLYIPAISISRFKPYWENNLNKYRLQFIDH